MKAVWLVASRQLASRLKFWTALVGYNPQEHTIGQGIYLVYVVIFFSLWGFAVLALLADFGARFLSIFTGTQPGLAAATIIALILLVDTILKANGATKQSPFIFSDDDAGLICQTPVNRSYVAMAWMISDWMAASLIYVILAVVLSFANLQLKEVGDIPWSHLPRYWLAGFRVISIIIPIQLALTGLRYALGAYRLRRSGERPALRWFPIGISAVLLGLGSLFPAGLKISLLPVQFPISAALGEASWVAGLWVAVLFAIIGILTLYWSSSELNLSRAAQESRSRWAYQQVRWLGDSYLSKQLKLREKMGAGHSPSQLPAKPGRWALLWKDWVITLRSPYFSNLLAWIGIFVAGLEMMLPFVGGGRLWAYIFWVLFVSQRGTERLRSDLNQWLIIRQLPFLGREILIPELMRPLVGITLLGWLAFGLCVRAGYVLQPTLILIIPVASLCIVLAATYDIFRQCRSGDLLSGQVAEMGAAGLLMGTILAGIPLGLTLLVAGQFTSAWINWLVGSTGLIIASGITYGLWRLTVSQYGKIK